MSSAETVPESPESDLTHINFDETELTLGLPGAEFRPTQPNKVYHKPNANRRAFHEADDAGAGNSTRKKPAAMGWPPVRSYRKKTTEMNYKYVKVAADGAPYLRKLDLQMFNGYHQLFKAFQELFPSYPICCNNLNPVKRADEYLPTYEDKDGDWMLVGDVPWKLFIESCKRIRLMKGSDGNGNGIAPRAP
ncbi:Auxin-induced protein AUX22 [Cucurbita argyrosperma subsp. argyrosperma]|nr:Auxin-induced protein AUX22 [Cucurbita argyrosperma subsp. argyrosperma]